MRRLRNLVPAFAILTGLCAAVPAEADIATSAEHAIIMDGETGQVLWAKDADASTPPEERARLRSIYAEMSAGVPVPRGCTTIPAYRKEG